MKKWLKILLIVVVLLVSIIYVYIIFPLWGMPFNAQRHKQLPLTPAWALENWLWEDDLNTSEYVDELLDGYKEHDIPVRTIIIDSPWSLRYNDFEIDTSRYPNPSAWFQKLEDNDYRVVLWMTSMVNNFSKDTKIRNSELWYNEAKDKGYLVGSEKLNHWWKGDGGFIDYSNPEGMKWWRGMQQDVFDLGIDGWKLDGAATLFWTEIFGIPFFYKRTKAGLITTRAYMDQYYREEYKHGLTQNSEFVTLTRSFDRKYAHPEGFAPFDAAPVNWVGDQKHTWSTPLDYEVQEENKDLIMENARGITMAIEHILESARLGYNIIGSDVAGFSGSEIPPRLYMRWTQLSTFCGLFMNGGHGERRLWKRTEEELEVIRKFSWLHTELVPYMYHYVVSAYRGGRRLQKVIKEGKYHYMFGDDFLVAPIYVDSKRREVSLPKGEWRYFFNDTELINGDTTFTRAYPMDEFPVFIKEGAIVPMNIKRDYTNIGDKDSEGFLTILIYPKKENSFEYYHPDTIAETNIHYSLNDENEWSFNIIEAKIPHILKIHSDLSPSIITLDGVQILKGVKWKYDVSSQKIIIKTRNYLKGNYKIRF